MKIKKPVLTAITIIIVCVLVICTFLSRTVMTSGQPSVQAVIPSREAIYTTREITGEVNYEHTQQFIYDMPFTVMEVFISSGDTVAEDTVLMEVDSRELALELKRKDLKVKQIQNRIENTDTADTASLDILRLELEIAETELSLFKEKYPTDGKIHAAFAGTVYNINAAKGESIPSNVVLASIYDGSSNANVIFYLPEEDAKYFGEGDSAILHLSEVYFSGSDSTEIGVERNSTIISKQFILKDDLYKFSVPAENENVWHGQQLRAEIIHKSSMYDKVIPSQALNREPDGSVYIFTINPRQGIWGEEYYTGTVNVNVLYDDGVNAAVSDIILSRGERVVTYTSKPLVSGEVVGYNTD
ncbi:MAG: efflux RND transporter periplasmic adaptor subunit [Eubacteriales bacterium]